MCLVTYLPTETGYLLTSNRDEEPRRAETTLITEDLNGHQVTYPRDLMGGSWIFSAKDNHNVVLLNGAFQLHERKLPYRMSRGIMVKAFFDYPTVSDFLQQFDFVGLEPFTLVINTPDTFIELRWDSQIKHIKTLNRTQPHIWSSCTLYNDSMQTDRKTVIDGLIQDKEHTLDLAQTIHNHSSDLPLAYDLNMARDGRVKTISTTYIVSDGKESTLTYVDKSKESL